MVTPSTANPWHPAIHMTLKKTSTWFVKNCSNHCIVAALAFAIYALLAVCIFIEYPTNYYNDYKPRMYYLYASILLKLMCILYYAANIAALTVAMSLFLCDLVVTLLYASTMFLGVNSAACDNPVFAILYFIALTIVVITLMSKESIALAILVVFISTHALVLYQIYIVITCVERVNDGVNYYLHPGDISIFLSCVLSIVACIVHHGHSSHGKRIIGVYACIIAILLATYLSAVIYLFK